MESNSSLGEATSAESWTEGTEALSKFSVVISVGNVDLSEEKNRQLRAISREKSLRYGLFRSGGIPQGALEGGGPGCEGAASLLCEMKVEA